jgi:succinate-semialdehyde dehydrogenase/glutarate-semialdehyde dehydrogenase
VTTELASGHQNTQLAAGNPERARAADAVLHDLQLPSGPIKFDVHNPATGEVIATVPDVGPVEALRAVARADAAGREWAATSPRQRADTLRRWYDLLVLHAEKIALLITRVMGKPLAESRAEVVYGTDFVR